MTRGYRKFEAYIGYFLVPRAFECFLGEREGELEEQVETTKRGCCSCAGGKEPEVIATEAVAADGEAIVGVELDSRVGVEDASEKTKTSGGDANAAAGSFAVSASDLTDSGDQATLAVIAEAGARGEGVARFEAWRRAEGEEASGTCGSETINSSRASEGEGVEAEDDVEGAASAGEGASSAVVASVAGAAFPAAALSVVFALEVEKNLGGEVRFAGTSIGGGI
jgi:hypothetical protein